MTRGDGGGSEAAGKRSGVRAGSDGEGLWILNRSLHSILMRKSLKDLKQSIKLLTPASGNNMEWEVISLELEMYQ